MDLSSIGTFPDISDDSRSKRYKLEALSPDDRRDAEHRFRHWNNDHSLQLNAFIARRPETEPSHDCHEPAGIPATRTRYSHDGLSHRDAGRRRGSQRGKAGETSTRRDWVGYFACHRICEGLQSRTY